MSISSGQVRHCVTAFSHASIILTPLVVLHLDLSVLIWSYFCVQLHAAVVELTAGANAEIKYSTVQNWYSGNEEGVGGIYNFVTKRGLCHGNDSKISWTQVWAQFLLRASSVLHMHLVLNLALFTGCVTCEARPPSFLRGNQGILQPHLHAAAMHPNSENLTRIPYESLKAPPYLACPVDVEA